jgi:uncharacterized protein YbaP (TraB family)
MRCIAPGGRSERVSMIQAARQRAVPTHARSGGAPCLLLTMLVSAAVSAGTLQQAAQTPRDAAQPAVDESQAAPAPIVAPTTARQAGTRGISAQAATDAANSQLVPAEPAGQSVAPQATMPADTAAATSIVPAPAALPGMRGVLFRITPPQATLLPAETLQSQGATPVTPAAIADHPASATAVPAPAAPRPSYLLATIHFGTPEEQGIDYAELERTLASVETFVNEANPDEAWKPEYDDYRWLPVENPLSSMVGKDAFAKARALLPNVRPQDLDRMKPWSVLALLEARGESGGEATMDARLQRIAAASGKRILHLESLEQQLQALDCVPALEHVRVLDERLRASWILRIESAQAMAWYRARNLEAWLADIDRMEGLSNEARAVEQLARRCLLEDRNARWIGQLETLFQDGPCLAAVGAVHLVGAEGLLAALRRDGYHVEALPL